MHVNTQSNAATKVLTFLYLSLIFLYLAEIPVFGDIPVLD